MKQDQTEAVNSPIRKSQRARTHSVPKLVSSDEEGLQTQPTMVDPKNGNDGSSSEDDDECGGKGKSRRELPAGAVSTLKAWLLSPEHFTHPYPTPQDQIMLMQKTGIDKKQLKNWFTNARRRIWKPMLKKQLDSGKLTATGAGGGGVAVAGVMPGLMVANVAMPTTDLTAPDNSHSIHVVYQQGQPQQSAQQYDNYGNPVYVQAPTSTITPAPAPVQYYQPQYGQQIAPAPTQVDPSGSIGSLAPIATLHGNPTPAPSLSKNDSHAVLMELFARDQDLVRRATESANLEAATNVDSSNTEAQQATSQHPMKMGSQPRFLGAVPSLNSWPHFSSISSLNNLGTMTGVKSITSMSGADLASQGNLNKMGNLAQVKSMESLSMGKNDSYAFLEVFFGDRSMSSTNMLGSNGRDHRGVKRERDEDNDVGLSLDEDAPASTGKSMENAPMLGTPLKDTVGDTGTLKRAYDDALAARGLISVSRSSERLTDLVLPAKMQKTLSQEFLRSHQTQAAQLQSPQQQQYGQQYMYSAPAPVAASPVSQQYPGQHPQQQQAPGAPQQQYHQQQTSSSTQQYQQQGQGSILSSDPSVANATVEVRSDAKCAVCQGMCVDTQLRPCGHMFHERCLKPSLQTPMGCPKCPIDGIAIQSALLAVPTDDNNASTPVQPWNSTPAQAPSTAFPVIPAGTQSSKA